MTRRTTEPDDPAQRAARCTKPAGSTRGREEGRWIVDGLDLQAECKRLCALGVVRGWMRERGLRRVELTVAWSRSRRHTTGHAKVNLGVIHLGLYHGCLRHEAEALLAHELAHVILPPRHGHDALWRRALALIVSDGYKVGLPSQLQPIEGTMHDLHARIEDTLGRRIE